MDNKTNNCQGYSDRKFSAFVSDNHTTKHEGPSGWRTQERCYRNKITQEGITSMVHYGMLHVSR